MSSTGFKRRPTLPPHTIGTAVVRGQRHGRMLSQRSALRDRGACSTNSSTSVRGNLVADGVSPLAKASRFENAMQTNGVFLLAVDSRMAVPRDFSSFGHLINSSRWQQHPGQPLTLSLSYTSSRVPTLVCAQPSVDNEACGAFDLVLLFASNERLWQRACSATLHDACGQAFCAPRGARRYQRLRECPRDVESARTLCGLQGGGGENSGRCRIPTAGVAREPGALHMEHAMLAFQRACEGARGNQSFALQPTCYGKYVGLLHNELQFASSSAVEDELPAAFLGVATIDIASERSGLPAALLAQVTAQRRCRARRLIKELNERFALPATELWSFLINASVGARRKTPFRFRSAAHSSKGGGGGRLADFRAAVLPLASFAGYYTTDSKGHSSATSWRRMA